MDKNTMVLAGAALIAIVLIAAVLVLTMDQRVPVACTMEAKLCPDGSVVGRTGPTCEFAIPKGDGPDVAFVLRYYGSMTPGNYSGGLVGDNSGSTITNSY